MDRRLPPLAVVVGFIDAINCGDLERLGRLMTESHQLRVLDEPPVEGRAANLRAWRGYMTSFPFYVIHPTRLAAAGSQVAVLGATTGSHLGLPDAEEIQLSVIWIATVLKGKLDSWQIAEDSRELRDKLGLT